jgi:hypothetical protein
MGSTSTARSSSTTAVHVKAQVDVHRTLAHEAGPPTLWSKTLATWGRGTRCARAQRLLNWKRARAAFWPYFLRSFLRGSRVT